MHCLLWNAAASAKKTTKDFYFAGVHTPSDPSYHDDPTRVTGSKQIVIGSHSSDMQAIFG
eukprot:CAMPEP_0172159090 /NCGR_PEP_ID=MMETSP1050-20130122/4762_1 /TAXON_ID=233186 /ORGANISM="Cryptomonas curvata, Strain CCAP979/52" /LENGTH=59 /DNA_ID=CAMNT_0012828609 /DNA_START=157 /DNA_END=336 /DNA_ORIENTATION=+